MGQTMSYSIPLSASVAKRDHVKSRGKELNVPDNVTKA